MDKEYVILKLDFHQASLHKEIYRSQVKRVMDELGILRDKVRDKEKELQSYQRLLDSVNGSEVLRKELVGKTESQIASDYKIAENLKYGKDLTLAKKSEYVLKDSYHLMSVRHIGDAILALEPGLLKTKEITSDQFLKNLSATLLQKVTKKDTFFRETVNGEYRYGLINLKEEYL